MESPPAFWPKLAAAVLWAAAAVVLGYHLVLECSVIGLPEPMGMAETIYASIARSWPHEYQWGYYVAGHDYYGPGYPTVVHAFQALVAGIYPAFRTANLVSLLAACGVLTAMLRIARCPVAPAAAVVAIVFSINAGSYSIQARPDFLVLLEIAGMLALGQLAVRGRIGPWVLGAALGLLALAGYLTKPYAVFAWGAALSYLALFVDLRRGLLAGAVSGAILAAGIGLYARFNPYYLLETFSANFMYSTPEGPWLVHQLIDFSTLACGLIAMAVFGYARASGRRAGDAGYWAWVTGLSLAVLLAGPGWHIGAYLTYFIHLSLLPMAMLAVTVCYPAASARPPWPATLLLLANLAVLLYLAPALPRPDPEWARLRADVLAQHGPVVVDSILEPLSRERPDTALGDTGIVKYALEESVRMGTGTEPRRRAVQESEALRTAWAQALRARPPAALYLDYIAVPNPQAPGGQLHVLRNGLPWFSGSNLSGYTVAGTFHLRPYYCATNERRQYAGTWETLIIKLVPRAAP